MPDREQVIKALEKAIRMSESVDSGWVWITIEQARKGLELLKEGNDDRQRNARKGDTDAPGDL